MRAAAVSDVLTPDVLGEPALAFTVDGRPAPQGSKSAVVRKGRVSMFESSKAVKPWRKAVALAAVAAVGSGWEPLDGPLVADVVLTMPRPRALPKTLRRFPAVAPDLSKLLRATEDALDTDSGVIANDSRLVAFRRLAEFYVGDPDPDALPYPGAVIRLWRHPYDGQRLVLAARDATVAGQRRCAS